MGSFNVTCALSGLPILEENPVRILVGVKTEASEDSDVQPIPISFRAEYDGYGGFTNYFTDIIHRRNNISNLEILETIARNNFIGKNKKFDHYNIHQMSPIMNNNYPDDGFSEKIFFHADLIDKVLQQYKFEGYDLLSILNISKKYISIIHSLLKSGECRKSPFSLLSSTLNDSIMQNNDIDDDMSWFVLRIAPKNNIHLLPFYDIVDYLHEYLKNDDIIKASLIFESYVTTQFLILIMKQARRPWIFEGYSANQNCDLDLAESISHATLDEINKLRK